MEASNSCFNDGEGYPKDGSGGSQGISAGEVGLRFLVAAAIVLMEMVEEGVCVFFFLLMDEGAVFSMPRLLKKSHFSKLNPNQPITKHMIGNF